MADNNNNSLKVNYYVGAVLAQGGNVTLTNDKLVFSPTSAIDKAMGAKDVEIPFTHIVGLEHKGTLARTFNILTESKIHKFEGNQAKLLANNLKGALEAAGIKIEFVKKEMSPDDTLPPGTTFTICESCARSLRPDFSFCPYCGHKIKK